MPVMIQKNMNRSDAYQESWVETQLWAKSHTKNNDIFIVPIYLSGFRVFSERGEVVDWKDGSAGYLAPLYLKEWWSRMEVFGLTKTNYNELSQKLAYWELSDAKVKKIGHMYNASYFVNENGKGNHDLKEVYKNGNFTVYKL